MDSRRTGRFTLRGGGTGCRRRPSGNSLAARERSHRSALAATADCLSKYGWFQENSGRNPSGWGKLRPNFFGVFDLYGNAVEWCHDRYIGYDPLPLIDPFGIARASTGFIAAGLGRRARGFAAQPTAISAFRPTAPSSGFDWHGHYPVGNAPSPWPAGHCWQTGNTLTADCVREVRSGLPRIGPRMRVRSVSILEAGDAVLDFSAPARPRFFHRTTQSASGWSSLGMSPERDEEVAGDEIHLAVGVEIAEIAGGVVARDGLEGVANELARRGLLQHDDRIQAHLAAKALIVRSREETDGNDVLIPVPVDIAARRRAGPRRARSGGGNGTGRTPDSPAIGRRGRAGATRSPWSRRWSSARPDPRRRPDPPVGSSSNRRRGAGRHR